MLFITETGVITWRGYPIDKVTIPRPENLAVAAKVKLGGQQYHIEAIAHTEQWAILSTVNAPRFRRVLAEFEDK